MKVTTVPWSLSEECGLSFALRGGGAARVVAADGSFAVTVRQRVFKWRGGVWAMREMVRKWAEEEMKDKEEEEEEEEEEQQQQQQQQQWSGSALSATVDQRPVRQCAALAFRWCAPVQFFFTRSPLLLRHR